MSKTIFFELRESGDENLPFVVWDKDDDMPFTYHTDLTDGLMGMLKANWAETKFLQTGKWPG